MVIPRRLRIFAQTLVFLCILFASGIGVVLGIALAETRNLQLTENLGETELALPTQILDKNGNLLAELFSEEKRDLISYDEVPKHLIYALVTREDEHFFRHKGFNLQGFIRAFWNNLRGTYFSGGSSITQQVAGLLYDDRTEITYRRKLRELWYAFQLERKLTKHQILELYMNSVYLGHNTYGVEAASQFYFGHSVREITLAESAILVIQYASPARYSIINHPAEAQLRQKEVLDQMVEFGYVTTEEAERSFDEFWATFDSTRSNTATAYFDQESKAAYFTEYVRLQVEDILFGSLVDVNRDGLIVHSTLDVGIQEQADDHMTRGIHQINARYRVDTALRVEEANNTHLPVIEALSLLFDIDGIRVAGEKQKRDAVSYHSDRLNPVLDALSLVFNSRELRNLSNKTYNQEEDKEKKQTVEGALITLENDTGYILAMVGGSEFKTKQHNRAVDATVQPGSAFKPLYYSVAISSRMFTPATMIMDGPMVFFNPDGTQYQPLNFLGQWSGPVRVRYALARSMNVPSTKVMDAIGFDLAIERTSRLLGMYDLRNDENLFPRKYPLALGVVSIAPIHLARAYVTFPNQGKIIEPIAIRYIEDRQGNILLDYERQKINELQEKSDKEIQILTPQEAYIMVSMLQSVVEEGTLRWRRVEVGGFDGMPMAGKTGTTENWSDAWTVGFSPYMTTAVWFGFDLPGESLGRWQTGATAAGPIWARYMKAIHADLPRIEFAKPETGLISRKICAISGLLPTEFCDEGTVDEIFLAGTEPTAFCDIHPYEFKKNELLLDRIRERLLVADREWFEDEIRLPSLEEAFGEFSSDSEDTRTGFDIDRNGGERGNPLLD